MTQETREILERALGLPREARAEVAQRLIESLDDDPGEVARAWRDEALRRAKDVIEGREPGLPLDEAVAEVKASLARARERRRAT